MHSSVPFLIVVLEKLKQRLLPGYVASNYASCGHGTTR